MKLDFFLKDILPIGIIITLISTILSIYFTRKNIKTTKYIETISSERIKWIQIIRNEITELISWIIIYENNIDYLTKKRIDKFAMEQHFSFVADKDEYLMPHEESEYNNLVQELNTIEKEFKSGLSRKRILEKAILLKLKFNPDEDQLILIQLDKIINQFSSFEKERSKTEIEIDKIILYSQQLLKREWEKVKNEVTKK